MEPIIYSSHELLSFQPSLPREWDGPVLSGSRAYHSQGPNGIIVIQKFVDEEFSISYALLNFLKKVKLFWSEQPILRLQYILDGKLKYSSIEGKIIKLRSGQMNGLWAPDRETSAEFTKGKFELFQIAFTPQLVRELIPEFPDKKNFPLESYKQWIGEDKSKDIHEVLNMPYTGHARSFFYKTKAREFLLSFLLPTPAAGLERYSEEQIERIYKIDHKILENLNVHYSTEELARFAKMSESNLIESFKEIIGVSMFDRYKEAKLQKAKRYLLETDVQVKVLYEMVGYGSYTGFVDAFKQRFGLSPLKFRKKYRPFD